MPAKEMATRQSSFLGITMSEFQKPYTEAGRLNYEIIFRKHFHENMVNYNERCGCKFCNFSRRDLKQKVNKLMNRKFYKDI